MRNEDKIQQLINKTTLQVISGDHRWFWKTLQKNYSVQIKGTLFLKTLFSLHIRSMWETTVMHKQVSGWTVNFGPNFPEYPFLELKTRIPPPFRKTSDLGWPKFTLEYPPAPLTFRKTSDLGWPKFTPQYPPPFRKTSDLGWPKFTPEYPPPPFRKTSDLGWPKFTPEYPPPMKIVRESKSEIFRIPRVTICGDFIQPG